MDHAAARLAAHKGEGFALLTAPDSTNEEHYLAQKFARVVMQSNNVDQTSNTHPELVLSLERSLGHAAATNSIWDLERSQCILVFNCNVTEEQNVAAVPIKKAAKESAKLVVIDPREVELTRYATLWLRPTPGAELLLLGAILRSLIDQGLERTEWLEENCESPATLVYALHNLDMEQAAQATNVSLEAIAEAARLFGQAETAAVVYALDNIPAVLQRDCVRALTNLTLLTANLGRPGSGLYPLRQGANEQGAWDVGCLPDRLPGYAAVADGGAREALESAWECALPAAPGMDTASALEAAGDGRLRAMLLVGDSADLENGAHGDGAKALEALEFLVVADAFMGPAAQRASVVLPRAAFAEKDGTFTNLERRIQRLKPAMRDESSQARPESWVLCQLAQRMGHAGFGSPSAAETMDEIARVTPIYGGVSYQRLEASGGLVFRTHLDSPQPTQVLYSGREHRGIQWPCPSPDAETTPTLYVGGFPGQKADFETPQFRVVESPRDSSYPALLVPGRGAAPGRPGIRGGQGAAQPHRQGRPAGAQSRGTPPPGTFRTATGWRPRTAATASPAGRWFCRPYLPGVIGVTSLFGQMVLELQDSTHPVPASRLPGLRIRPARIAKIEASE